MDQIISAPTSQPTPCCRRRNAASRLAPTMPKGAGRRSITGMENRKPAGDTARPIMVAIGTHTALSSAAETDPAGRITTENIAPSSSPKVPVAPLASSVPGEKAPRSLVRSDSGVCEILRNSASRHRRSMPRTKSAGSGIIIQRKGVQRKRLSVTGLLTAPCSSHDLEHGSRNESLSTESQCPRSRSLR